MRDLMNKNKDYINEFYLPVKIKVSAEKDKVKIINDPTSIRNISEKLFSGLEISKE